MTWTCAGATCRGQQRPFSSWVCSASAAISCVSVITPLLTSRSPIRIFRCGPPDRLTSLCCTPESAIPVPQLDESGALGSTDWFADADGDGYGDADAPLEVCEPPSGYTDVPGDCDDLEPQVNPDAVVGLTFEMSFGSSTIRSTGRVPVRERMRLVGFSDRAIPLGVTLPLEFVRAMNVRFGKAKAAGVSYTNMCAVVYSGMKGFSERVRGVTNSAKNRNYSPIRYFPDKKLVDIAVTGKV